jgi:hypothetical protein
MLVPMRRGCLVQLLLFPLMVATFMRFMKVTLVDLLAYGVRGCRNFLLLYMYVNSSRIAEDHPTRGSKHSRFGGGRRFRSPML